MIIIGVDYHPGFQQIAFLVEETGECGERRLNHSDGEAEKFYRDLKARGTSVRVGMETTGFSRWFERLLAELGFEVWIGDAAEIKTSRAKKQKTDRRSTPPPALASPPTLRPSAMAPEPRVLALGRAQTCDWTCELLSDISFSRRLSPSKGISNPNSIRVRARAAASCSQVSTKPGASSRRKKTATNPT
jgi:hypothetical protein